MDNAEQTRIEQINAETDEVWREGPLSLRCMEIGAGFGLQPRRKWIITDSRFDGVVVLDLRQLPYLHGIAMKHPYPQEDNPDGATHQNAV